MTLVIDDARDGDAAALASLLDRVPWRDASYTAERLAAAARADPMALHVVARVDGRVVGGGVAYGGGRWAQPDRAFMIPALFVDEPQRRHGVGSAIAARLETHAFDASAARVVTTVRADEESGLAFAASRGYREFHRETNAVLDLSTWERSPIAPSVSDDRVRSLTLREVLALGPAEAKRIGAAIQRAHEELLSDLPPSEIAFPRRDAEAYEREVVGALDRDASVIAMRGDDVAAIVLVERRDKNATILAAGEVGPGRGRKLIFDAKVRAISALRDAGARQLRSIFDRDNAMSRQLNRSLGFEILPPLVRLELRR